MIPAGRDLPGTHRSANGFFAAPLREYVLQDPGRPVSLLQAGCLFDRLLPGLARKALWSRMRPDIPGPFPAVYEKTVSDAGIASYAQMRGLVIAARGAELTLPSSPERLSSSVRTTYGAIARLTRGRFGDSHDELLYVIRKPQDRFARVV